MNWVGEWRHLVLCTLDTKAVQYNGKKLNV
jgi:hypothetical protein